MAGQSVPVLDPRISVVLKKNITREFVSGDDGLGGAVPASGRFQDAEREIDLTPYLGEAGGVRTTKSVREPAGGFTVTLADRMVVGSSQQQESLYGLIEPMDVIEIRLAHSPTAPSVVSEYQRLPKQLPIVMRGFVSTIQRTEVMSPDGKPQRAVKVAGQDYGKLWQTIQIYYLSNFVIGQQLLTFLKFAQNYGVQPVNYTPNAFIHEAVSQIFNQFTAMMRRGGAVDAPEDPDSPVLDVTAFDLSVPDTANVSPFGINAFQGGTLYQLLAHYGDVGAFNELFIQDREDGVAVVYRPTPFKRPDGSFIQSVSAPFDGGSDAGLRQVRITDADIVSSSVGRTDGNVANYFWVDNPSYQLSSANTLRLLGVMDDSASYLLDGYRNSAPWLYGFRKLEVQTNQGYRFDGQAEADVAAGSADMADWLAARRQVLIDTNRDNVVFESGTMTLRGNERLRPGDYLVVERGSLESEVYVTQVDQLYMPFRSYTTNITFERGTGFIERAQQGRGDKSPYLAEARGTGAYGGAR